MAKQEVKKVSRNTKTTKKANTKKVVSSTSKKKTNAAKSKNVKLISMKKRNFFTMVVLFFVGILLIFSTYAWLSTSLNVKIKNFSMVVSRNSGLSISLDGITFGKQVEISEEVLIDTLKNTYPNNTSQWSSNGLIPVSSNGISNPNNTSFDVYASTGVKYKDRRHEEGYVTTFLSPDIERRAFNSYIAFDVFLKNETGSPVSDNIYLDPSTFIVMDSDSDEEMQGLVNSARIGFVVMGTVPIKSAVNAIQNVSCYGNCRSIIFEPNHKDHTDLSIERALKYGINLVDGEQFPTYACVKAGGPIKVNDNVSGSTKLDYSFFNLQQTITEEDLGEPIFKIPDGITKIRVYVWIEGQDIDSLETDSEGADISISIDFSKDTFGYDVFN